MPIATTFGSSVGFTYSWSSVYSSSFGISDTARSSSSDGGGKLGAHLCGDHLHGLRLAQAAVFDEALEADGAIRVDEDDAVEAVGHVSLEEQGDVAHDDAVPAFARLIDQLGAKAFDFRVDDLV